MVKHKLQHRGEKNTWKTTKVVKHKEGGGHGETLTWVCRWRTSVLTGCAWRPSASHFSFHIWKIKHFQASVQHVCFNLKAPVHVFLPANDIACFKCMLAILDICEPKLYLLSLWLSKCFLSDTFARLSTVIYPFASIYVSADRELSWHKHFSCSECLCKILLFFNSVLLN